VGSSYRVKAGNLVLWLDESKASFYSSMPRKNTETGNLVFSSSGNIVSAKFAIYDKVPYMAFAQGGKFNLDLFNTSLHTNWVIYDSSIHALKMLHSVKKAKAILLLLLILGKIFGVILWNTPPIHL